MKAEIRRNDLIFPEISYKIVGACFGVYNDLGPGFHEKHYQKALALELRAQNIGFSEQVPVNLSYKSELIGRYFLDFLIEDKVIVELKKGNRFSPKYIEQVLGYLKSTGLKLAILIHFGNDSVRFKRIVNRY